jgi:hypothetical protein
MKWFVYLLVLLVSAVALADDFDDTDELAITRAKAFIKQYPVIEGKVDEIGVVNFWQRIQGLQNLISIWDSNREAFNRQGTDELGSSQLRERIASHRRYARYTGDDAQVQALVDIIQLHATMADRYMKDEITYQPYADVAGFAVITGRNLAKTIWIRYGKCTRDRSRQKQGQNQDKLLM